MKTKIISAGILAMGLMAGVACADGPRPAAPRPAKATIEALSHYSPKDTSQDSVMDDLGPILGKPDNQGVDNQNGNHWTFYSYELSDYSQVIVEFMRIPGQDGPQLAMITAERPDKKLVRLGGIPGVGETAHHSAQR